MKIPPHKPDIEYYLASILILEPEIIMRLPVKEEHFYSVQPLLAFKTLVDMQKADEKINLVTFGGRFADVKGKISEFKPLFEDFENVSSLYAESYLRQLAEETAKRKIWLTYQDLADAPKDFIEEMKKIELDFIDQQPKNAGQLLEDYKKDYDDRKKRMEETGAVGLITGFNTIDTKATFEPGNLIVLAAKTSVGKTALALNISVNASMFGQNVLFFSAEMTSNELMGRVLSQLSGVSATRFKYANADHSMSVAETQLPKDDTLQFIEAGQMTSDDVCRISRQASQRQKIDLVVVDYIQYLKDPTLKGQTNNDRIGNITRNFSGLAKDLKCPVLALSQVNRAASGAPELQHLRDSGNIEQDSDIVLILHRESKDAECANLAIAKNRNGMIEPENLLYFTPKTTRFYEKGTNPKKGN